MFPHYFESSFSYGCGSACACVCWVRQGDGEGGVSASEYWDALERLLSEEISFTVPDRLVELGWAPAENLHALLDLMAEHDGVYCYEDDEDRCKCGKWIEWDHYEWPDHVSSVLEDSGLLMPGRPWDSE